MSSLLHLSVDADNYSIFEVPITQPDMIPNITNQTNPNVFSFTYPAGVSIR
jgi:hypothetical protein